MIGLSWAVLLHVMLSAYVHMHLSGGSTRLEHPNGLLTGLAIGAGCQLGAELGLLTRVHPCSSIASPGKAAGLQEGALQEEKN